MFEFRGCFTIRIVLVNSVKALPLEWFRGSEVVIERSRLSMSEPVTDSSSPSAPKLSPVEKIKLEGNYLRGTIAQELVDGTDAFSKASEAILKHHGTYLQDDRDLRSNTKDRPLILMVRTRIPGGRLTPEQMLAEIDLGDQLGNQTIRLTTRQAIQHHGIPKGNLRELIHRINEIKLSTLAACGDVNRNVMCCPAPYKNAIYDELHRVTDRLVEHLAPKTKAYYELWVKDLASDEKELVGGATEDDVVEPIYGKTYLPRKFKSGIGLPYDNCIDIYTQDLGFLAIIRDGKVVGFNVLVGGGMGTTPANKKTYPALAKRMAFCTLEQVCAVAEAVVKVQRDHGNREDRKQARMKYLVDRWGIERFRSTVEEYYGGKLPDCEPDDVTGHDDHIGWFEQGDGKWFYGLNIENGRVKDDERTQLKQAIRDVCNEFGFPLRVTSHQSLLFCDVESSQREALMRVFRRYGVKTSEEFSTVRRWSMACVAWPTCGLAITESERALPGIMDELEPVLESLGLQDEAFTVRMTGCPNGCARPYNADVGIVGKAKDRYTLYLGGGRLGKRLGFVYKDMVAREELLTELRPVLVCFKERRENGESFGDFCHRMGAEELAAAASGYVA